MCQNASRNQSSCSTNHHLQVGNELTRSHEHLILINSSSLLISLNTFQSLRNMTTPPNNVSILDSAMGCKGNNSGINDDDHDINVEECCICLYALAPFQSLFVAPCSHTFHYKCVRPLLNNHPGFLCPLCRSYADLDASVAVEASEVSSS